MTLGIGFQKQWPGGQIWRTHVRGWGLPPPACPVKRRQMLWPVLLGHPKHLLHLQGKTPRFKWPTRPGSQGQPRPGASPSTCLCQAKKGEALGHVFQHDRRENMNKLWGPRGLALKPPLFPQKMGETRVTFAALFCCLCFVPRKGWI